MRYLDAPRLIAGLVVALVSASAALAQPTESAQAAGDPLAGYYGNALRIEVQDYLGLRFFEPDHTYRDRVRGKMLKGAWTVEATGSAPRARAPPASATSGSARRQVRLGRTRIPTRGTR